ncbi:hypothetical protein HYV21_02090, partial [Candidatus Microgenomates bacterium]|nr:hypothetical protein [Candidatus Microgenomates bacterium]
QEFEARFGEGVVGHAEHTTGDIFISSESPSFRSTFNAQPKDVLPYWSTLSRARTVYWHEFFHKAAFGSNRKPEQGLEMIVKADNKDYHLEAIHGFTLEYVNKESGQSKFSGSFDEGFVTYLVSTVERQMSGFVVYESSPEGETGTPGIKIDRVVNRLEALFKKRRSWEKVFQKFHMESDFFGLARFLASQSGLSFDTNFKRDAYGLGIILSMSDDNAPNFDDFITRLK